MEKDYYKILGIHPDSSEEEIKEAYRRRAHKYHPDKSNGDEARFKEAHNAYEVLGNPTARAEYDKQYYGSANTGSAYSAPNHGSVNSTDTTFKKTARTAGKVMTSTVTSIRWVVFILILVGIGSAIFSHFSNNQTILSSNSTTQSPQLPNSDDQPSVTQSQNQQISFICPEDYSTPKEKTDAIAKFISDYTKKHPKATLADLYSYRHDTLVANSCLQTLSNLLQKVTPDDLKLYFAGKDFGPQNIQYTNNTKVWSSYYTLNGTGLANPDEELILNFYLQGVWAEQPFTAQDIAQTIANSYSGNLNAKVINKFTAPDNITKLPDYFIFSETIYEGYAYVYVIKISTFQNNVFSITYSKKFTDDNSNLESDIDNWIIQDAKLSEGASMSLGDVGVDATWLSYFAGKQN